MAVDLRADVEPLPDGGLDSLEPEWRDVEDRAGEVNPYVGYDWLSRWARVYERRELLVCRVRDPEGGLVAIGLSEGGRSGRWRFGGRPVGASRGLLCAADMDEPAWAALTAWLLANRREWRTFEVEGVPSGLLELPYADRVESPVFRIELPVSFDDYMAALEGQTRRQLGRRRRRFAEAGATVEPAGPERAEALAADFVRLHTARAGSKAERHPAIDETCARLLASLGDAPRDELRLFELRLGDRTRGVYVRIDRDGVGYSFNAGFDPEITGMAPGMMMELASVEDGIERGLRVADLGPGVYDYKLRLGGQPQQRWDVNAASSGLYAGAQRARHTSLTAARRVRGRVRALRRR